MKKTTKRILTGATSAVLMTAAVPAVVAETATVLSAKEEAAATYAKVANVQGNFGFNQNTVTPADEVFNLFGTAVTGMCAKPDFALTSLDKEYYVNVGGKIAHSFTGNLRQMNSRNRTMLCACATGAATAQAQITGVNVADILSMAGLNADAKALTVKSSDGYTQKLSIQYLLDKEAMLAYEVGGKEIPTGVQLWVPETVAKYFVRDVVELEVTNEDVAAPEGRAEELRAEIALKNTVENALKVGKAYTFEGYADDLGEAIAAVEFSMDGGETWTSYETAKASPALWVSWHFEYTPAAAGDYQLSVRARTASGKVSPLAANVDFTVEA